MRSISLLTAVGLLATHQAAPPSTRPTEIVQKQFPVFREIGAFYFDGSNESQVWVNVEPAHVEGPPDPIIFNATVQFPGMRLDREPSTVRFRPQVRCIPAVYPTRPRLPVFKLTIDSAPTIDLSPSIHPESFFMPSCAPAGADTNVTWDTVSTTVPFAMLRQVATAKTVKVDAIGFTVRLTPEDFTALNALVRTVEHGVVLKK